MAKKTPKTAAEEGPKLKVTDHALVPKHEVCSDDEKRAVLAQYKAQPFQMPRIMAKDPAIRHLSVKVGDLIKITRRSDTAGEAVFYRIVSSE